MGIEKIVAEQYQDLEAIANQYAANYSQAEPFPSISFKNFFNEAFLNEVLNEFPDLSKTNSIKFDNPNEKKLAGRGEANFGDHARQLVHFLNSEVFLHFLQKLTGIEEVLISDPYLAGGGFHEIKKGGLLKVHADFNKHPKLKLDRRLNILVYLNKDWKEEYGGHFELWDKDMTKAVTKILPEFNTLAMFSTTDFSYHGHPNPLNCPEGNSRKSIALYYYSNGRPQSEVNKGLEEHSTLFKKRKGDKSDKNVGLPFKRKVKNVVKDLIPPIITKALR